MYNKVKETRLMWGMPITIEIVETGLPPSLAKKEDDVDIHGHEGSHENQPGFPLLPSVQSGEGGGGM
ncbi:MAG TPA: hypothetical protein VF498_11265, partial [Anaerolineales bacterium]